MKVLGPEGHERRFSFADGLSFISWVVVRDWSTDAFGSPSAAQATKKTVLASTTCYSLPELSRPVRRHRSSFSR
jgi:hypothetical protein